MRILMYISAALAAIGVGYLMGAQPTPEESAKAPQREIKYWDYPAFNLGD